MDGRYKYQEREFEITHHAPPYNGWAVFENGKKIGNLYLTHHPTIPFEIFLPNGISSKRVNTIEEVIKFLIDEHTSD